MLSRKLTHKLDKPLAPLVKQLPPLGISPNMLTVAGAILNASAAVAIAYGGFLMGGILVMVGGVFDLLDGALARVAGKESKFGNLLDSTLDRYSDIMPMIGLLIYYTGFPRAGDVRLGDIVLCGIVILGSLMVPYVRAKAESIGLRCDVGIAERAERIIIFSGGLVIGVDVGALWALAILTHLTVIQRVLYAHTQLRITHEGAETPPSDRETLITSDAESDL